MFIPNILSFARLYQILTQTTEVSRFITLLTISLYFFIPQKSVGQELDTIRLIDNQIIVGEIKLLDAGILTVKTNFSKSDFTIKWEKVISIDSDRHFIIVLSNKLRMKGSIFRDTLRTNYMILNNTFDEKYAVISNEIIYLKPNEDKLLEKLSGNIDGGYNLTKASNNVQYSTSGKLALLTSKFNTEGNFNLTGNVTQDTIKSARQNYQASVRLFLGKSWFVLGASDFLKSDEQNLDLRSTYQIGSGTYFIRHYNISVSLDFGVAANLEKYLTEDNSAQNTTEAFGGLDINLYDWKSINLKASGLFLPSLSNKGRIRTNILFDLKIDLISDFYVGFYYSLNYDNQAETETSSTDFVIQTKIGWKF